MEAFDKVDAILQKQRYIAGDKMTLADIRLFVTLLRFDEVYQVYFKTNTRSVTHSPAILNYCRDIYQMPGVAATVDMEQIKYHYYCSHVELNTYSIVPQGNNFMELLKQTHNRSEM
jgi:putative glutathione S-transferase